MKGETEDEKWARRDEEALSILMDHGGMMYTVIHPTGIWTFVTHAEASDFAYELGDMFDLVNGTLRSRAHIIHPPL